MNEGHYRDWQLILIVLADDDLSAAALENLERICRQELVGCRPIVVDAARDPEILKKYQIFAIPTLILEKPKKMKKIIGSLANRKIVLQELGVQSTPPSV